MAVLLRLAPEQTHDRSESRQATESVRLVGRVVPDPAGYARVQSAQAARVVYDPAFPIPVPGQWVKRGQVVAVLEPNLSAIERSDKRAALYKVESEISLLERQLARWEQARGVVVAKEVETARVQLDNLHKEKTQSSTRAGRRCRRIPGAEHHQPRQHAATHRGVGQYPGSRHGGGDRRHPAAPLHSAAAERRLSQF